MVNCQFVWVERGGGQLLAASMLQQPLECILGALTGEADAKRFIVQTGTILLVELTVRQYFRREYDFLIDATAYRALILFAQHTHPCHAQLNREKNEKLFICDASTGPKDETMRYLLSTHSTRGGRIHQSKIYPQF